MFVKKIDKEMEKASSVIEVFLTKHYYSFTHLLLTLI